MNIHIFWLIKHLFHAHRSFLKFMPLVLFSTLLVWPIHTNCSRIFTLIFAGYIGGPLKVNFRLLSYPIFEWWILFVYCTNYYCNQIPPKHEL